MRNRVTKRRDVGSVGSKFYHPQNMMWERSSWDNRVNLHREEVKVLWWLNYQQCCSGGNWRNCFTNKQMGTHPSKQGLIPRSTLTRDHWVQRSTKECIQRGGSGLGSGRERSDPIRCYTWSLHRWTRWDSLCKPWQQLLSTSLMRKNKIQSPLSRLIQLGATDKDLT